jgi:hypothetical protein
MVRDWIRLQNGDLFNLNSSQNIIRVIKSRKLRWVGHEAYRKGMRNIYKILVKKCEGNRPLERPRHRWENKIRLDLREIGWEGVDWIHLA